MTNAESNTPMIVCDNLVKIYQIAEHDVVALQGLDLVVRAGELMGLVGVSGSGKSTLLNILGGLDRPSAGRIMVNGQNLLKVSDSALNQYRLNTAEISEIAGICTGKGLITDDPLGLGGLLTGACKIAQLVIQNSFTQPDLLEGVVASSLIGLDSYVRGDSLKLPADYRLAFRELGLSIGLEAAQRLKGLLEVNTGLFKKYRPARSDLEILKQYFPLREAINAFWLKRENRESAAWKAHRNINMVMLATSLSPKGYISLQ